MGRRCRWRRWRPRAITVAAAGSLLVGVAVVAAVAAADLEPLPPPERTGTVALEALLQARRSVRAFAPDTLATETLGQLLWAAVGTTGTDRFTHRTVPSAGALYPLEAHLLTARGVARYHAQTPAARHAHALEWRQAHDRRSELARAALGQPWVARAPAVIVLTAVPERTAVKYGARAERYVAIEVGCACQNVLLQATALGLGAVPVGAFTDEAVARVLALPAGERPYLILPVGRAATATNSPISR